jgi:membrane fusion protein (multidrug efflux system)
MSQSNIITRDADKRPAGAGSAGAGSKTGMRRVNRIRLLRPVLMIGGVLLVLIISLFVWLSGGQYVSSDDTYVEAAKVSLSTDVSGLVGQVYVSNNEHVTQGQILFSLRPAAFNIAVENAQAQLAQAELDVAAAKRGYAQSQAEIAAQKIQIEADQSNLSKYASVLRSGGVTQATYDNEKYQLEGDQAKLAELTDESGVQLAKLSGNADIPVQQTPEYQSALATLNNAQRELNNSVVRAPFSGTVTEVDQLQPGMFLPAGTAAFGLVSDTDVWITSQPKESDLTWVRPGQAVTITVDTYPDETWNGVVESISPASGSEFSILPAQNSSGNWVKVVQRIPVRVKITGGASGFPLRDGMSAEISIDTNHHRHLSDLF